MHDIESKIFAIVSNYFPGLDFLHQAENGLHTFSMIFFPPANFTINVPQGFAISSLQKHGSKVVFNLIVHEEIFVQLYHFENDPQPCYA